MKSLAEQQCQHIPEGSPALGADAAAAHLESLTGWSIDREQLTKTFSFKNYYETTAFLNATAWVSHRQDHHPDIALGYNKITFRYSTHTVKGLSINDFICAARIEELFK
jgi:4a-hydroxytetrahydrobiopterin dehydratase